MCRALLSRASHSSQSDRGDGRCRYCSGLGTYSPWTSGQLHTVLLQEQVSSIVVSSGETDVCVLATAVGAIDLGYHVTVLSDAVCSGADATHDAALTLLRDRFAIQLEVMTTERFLSIAR
jgi:nicotinamidase-related amidase